MLLEKFLDLDKKKEQPQEKKPVDNTSKEVMDKKEVKESSTAFRTLGNVRTAAEAQRIFNPNLPPTAPKGPTAAQQDSGTVANAGIEGNWGTAENGK